MSVALVLAWSRIMRPAARPLPDFWPAHSVVDGDDIRIDGVSLLDQARAGTPCARTGAAATRAHAFASVVVTRVVAVDGGVRVDAALDGCHPLAVARLIGRTSHAARVTTTVGSAVGGTTTVRTTLPSDLRVGDLLALPCLGATARYDIAHVARR